MKNYFIVSLAFFFLVFSTVLAQGNPTFPPPPPPSPPDQIIKCHDNDGGINYNINGTITFETIQAGDPNYQVVVENGNGDYCGEKMGASQGKCDLVSKIINEAYCPEGEINLSSRPTPDALKRIKYDCSLEGKVCYKGACVEEKAVKNSEEYKKDVAKCEMQLQKTQNLQKVGFWSRIFNWLSSLF